MVLQDLLFWESALLCSKLLLKSGSWYQSESIPYFQTCITRAYSRDWITPSFYVSPDCQTAIDPMANLISFWPHPTPTIGIDLPIHGNWASLEHLQPPCKRSTWSTQKSNLAISPHCANLIYREQAGHDTGDTATQHNSTSDITFLRCLVM